MRTAFAISLLLIVTLAVSPVHAQGDLYHFTPEQFTGRMLRYTMITTGEVSVRAGSAPTQTVALDLRAELEIAFASPSPTGSLPFVVRLLEANSSSHEAVGRSLTSVEVAGVLGRDGSLTSVETPRPLAELGLTFRELLAGLVVPAPATPAGVGSEWRVQQSNVEALRARSMSFTATYTAQGPKLWAGRTFPSVTARFSGQGSRREGSVVTQVGEIGHGLFYLQPGTGITEYSAVSIDTTVDTVQSGSPPAQTRIKLTTTLELRDSGQAALVPAVEPRTEPGAGELRPEPVQPAPAQPGQPVPGVGPSLPARGETIPEEPAPAVELTVYRDPAGRFSLALPEPWIAEPQEVALRRTRFERSDGAGSLTVSVMPLPNPAASAEQIARSTLATYQETQAGFTVAEQPSASALDGEAAWQALYRYRTADGRIATEVALFSRKDERAVYLQYTVFDRLDLLAVKAEFAAIASGFRFGPTPEGAMVPVDSLELASYTDPSGRFSISVPTLWPLTDRTSDGSSTTFTEVGENGFLSIFAQPGARGLAAEQIVAAWKDQSQSDPGYRLIADVGPSPLGGVEGARVDYEWTGGGGRIWVRRLQGAVVGDVFYAVVLDYVATGYEERTAVFDAIMASFTLLEPEPGPEPETDEVPEEPVPGAGEQQAAPAPETLQPEPAQAEPSHPAAPAPAPETSQAPPAAPQPAPASPAPGVAPVQVTPGQAIPGYPVEEPVGTDTVLLAGRFLMRYPAANGRTIEEWGAGIDVYVTAGGREYRATTDALGNFYIANLPRLAEGRFYVVDRIFGTMLGVHDATVTFSNLETGVTSPRVAHLGTVVLTRDVTNDVSVEVITTFSASQDSALDRFVAAYPASGWVEYVREAIAVSRTR